MPGGSPRRGSRLLFLPQTGTIDDLPLNRRAKNVLRNPPEPFSAIVTLEQFRTTLPRIADSELLRRPHVGRKTATEIRRVWTLYVGVTNDDEWPSEAGEALERAWGFRVRPGQHVVQPGICHCEVCGVSQQFSAGETAPYCERHAAQSEWLWRSGDEK